MTAITEVDEGLIAVLVADPRASLRRLAAEVGISEATARTRLAKLRTRGVVQIRGFGHPLAVPDSISVSLLMTRDGTTDVDLADPLFDQAQWIARATTRPVLIVEYFVKTTAELGSLIDALGRLPGVVSVQAAVSYRLHAGPGAGREVHSGPGTWTPALHRPLDDVDFALIRYLARDGRASYTELASSVGLSVPAARRRVVGLTKAGILIFWTIVDRATTTPHRALFRAVVAADAVPAFIESATRLRGVSYVVEQAYAYPIGCELIAADATDLQEVIDALAGLPGVLETMVEPMEIVFVRDVWGQFGGPGAEVAARLDLQPS